MWLEMCAEALSDGGMLSPTSDSGPPTPAKHGLFSHSHISNRNVGVFAATASLPTYLTEILYEGRPGGLAEDRANDGPQYWEMEVGNDKDYIATTGA